MDSKKIDIVHLHVHTFHSMLDGVASPTALLLRAKELGMKAIAITDHGSMGGHLEAQLEADKIGDIKVIFGIELYVVDDHKVHSKEQRSASHAILLAKSENGYKNLVKLNNVAWRDGFYYTPRIDLELLASHSKDLICLTACAKGIVARHILAENNIPAAKRKVAALKKIFGKDLYLEIQAINISSEDDKNIQEHLNAKLVNFSKSMEVELVTTNDVHFLRKGDDILQTRLVRIQREDFAYAAPDNWLKTGDEIWKSWRKYIPSVHSKNVIRGMENSVKIAEQCNYKIPAKGKFNIPAFSFKNHPNYNGEKTKSKFFARYLMDKLEEKGLDDKKDYVERLLYEYEIVSKLGVIDYFLIVEDLFRYAKEQGVLCHTRGSVNGSLIAYLLGLSIVDPIFHSILFERFLSPARLLTGRSDIDIDCDFEAEFRSKAILYLKKKYGRNRICQVGSYNRMQLRAAIKDMARVEYEISKDEDFSFQNINKITRTMFTNDLDRESENEQFSAWHTKHKKWVSQFVLPIVGNPRAFAGHPAGVTITPSDVDEWIPIRTQLDKKLGERIPATAWENSHTGREDLFARGLMCLDCLGVKTLSIISRTLQDVEKTACVTIKLENIPIDDERTMKAFAEGETLGVFQLSAPKITSIIKEMKPDKFEDIIALGAIDRPGPLQARAQDRYTKRKHGDEDVDYMHKSLESVLKDTYGVPIYSEHAMRMVTEFAGMDMVAAEKMRQVVKAKDPAVFKSFEKSFMESAVNKWGKDIKDKAKEIWSAIRAFGGYAFPKAHSTAYAYYGNATQYLKVRYPLPFFKNFLNYASLDEYAEIKRVAEKRYGIVFYLPNVNKSKSRFSMSSKGIRWALSAVKGVGQAAAHEIALKQPFSSFEDFMEKVNKRLVNKRVVIALITANAFRDFGKRGVVMEKYCEIRKEKVDARTKWVKWTEDDWNISASELLGFDLISVYDMIKGIRKNVQDYKDFEDSFEGRRLLLAGKVSKLHKHKFTRNGKSQEMLFIDMIVDGQEIPIVCWPNTLDEIKTQKISLPRKGGYALIGGVKGFRNDKAQLVMEPDTFMLEVLG